MLWPGDPSNMENCGGTYYSNESSPVPGRRTPLGTVGLGGYYFPPGAASGGGATSPSALQTNENRSTAQMPSHHHSENRYLHFNHLSLNFHIFKAFID